MKILYLGDLNPFSTSFHRKRALERLGHLVIGFNPWDGLSFYLSFAYIEFISNRSGYVFWQKLILKHLKNFIEKNGFFCDLIWINGGELFGPSILSFLRHFNVPIVLYNNDDPLGNRDKGRFLLLKNSILLYDLVVTVREATYKDLYSRKCKDILLVKMSYDEIAHAPLSNNEKVGDFFKTDISFVGTWMRKENRHPVLRALVDSGLKLNIYGPRWNKCPDSFLIKSSWKQGFLCGRDYVFAINGAKINIGLLSKGNRDQHTTRSFEIPFAGGLLCAQRTPEHLQLYRDGEDAVFWETPEELIHQCKRLLGDNQLRERIRRNGMTRVRQLGVGNETICQSILERATQCQIGR